MRIALSHTYAWPEVRRGAERYLHEVAAALRRAGHDVRILTTSPVAGTGTELGVPVRRLRRRGTLLRRRYGQLADQAAFGAQSLLSLGGSRLDVWHALSTADAAAAATVSRLRPGLRSVYTECGFPARPSREARPDHGLYRTTVRHVDEFVCLSRFAADLLQRDYGRQGVVVPAGVDLDLFAPGGAEHPEPVLLFPAAADEPRKHVDLFLEALALLRRDGHRVAGWLVGPGTVASESLSELAREGLAGVAVDSPAQPAELPDRYRRAWVTVLPAEAEVFGLVVLESMACGTPVVVLDDGLGPASLVTEGTGVKAIATARGVADACLDALDLARTPATAAACRDRAAAFSWDEAVVPALVRLYRGSVRL